jgi:hypothetical protein
MRCSIRCAPTSSRVTLYKVGHHGSRNATPKWLWNQFTRTGGPTKANRLISVLSTKAGKFDETHEVPRAALVTEPKARSEYHSTSDAPAGAEPTVISVTL